MKRIEIGLLPRILLAIALGVGCGFFFPEALTRVFLTFNALFGNFLNFIIPLLIIGLVVPGIADLGNSAGRLLLITAALSYGFTLFSGFFTYGACTLLYPWLLEGDSLSRMEESASVVEPISPSTCRPCWG